MWLSDCSILLTGQQTNLHIAASVVGVLSVGVLYCFGGGTARRVHRAAVISGARTLEKHPLHIESIFLAT